MLPTPEVVEAVAEELQNRGLVRLVVDPVLVSTSGDALATAGVADALKQHLLPLATVITPNIPEACKLLGDGRAITDVEAMRAAAEELHRYGPQWVLIKGGHLVGASAEHNGGAAAEEAAALAGPPAVVTDVLFDGKNMMELTEPYVSTGNTHGTGCSLASAIAAELAKGADVSTAVRRAKK
ncbi:hypothetical protein COHA_001959 [Chlorella ohadii]|uniref:Pyridoxamine kinase/Phosphomethylpyrimidine kinase domain-containing protein n=1 Tax=Chlorella ohadii TaxID=2649997 RepID=A0AAD5DYB3_9CHLO|nr:hypothetical protein COHA_001959 [Chlorella ohadii]